MYCILRKSCCRYRGLSSTWQPLIINTHDVLYIQLLCSLLLMQNNTTTRYYELNTPSTCFAIRCAVPPELARVASM